MIMKIGDCHELIKFVESESIDLILTDPPYNTTKNDWDQPLDWTMLWVEFARICKKHCPIIIFAQDKFSAQMINTFSKFFKHRWIWSKKSSANFAVAKYMPLTVTEDVLVFSARKEKVNYYPIMRTGKLRKRGSKNAKTNGEGFCGIKQIYYSSDQYYPTNLLEFPVVPRKQSLHPSQKPVEILEYLIETYSRTNDTILDITMGVGSTAIAAKKTNRQFIGFEKEAKYYTIATDRVRPTPTNTDECRQTPMNDKGHKQ